MNAVVYEGPGSVNVKEVPDLKIEGANDAMVRLTTSMICGSDLHMYDGHTPAGSGIIPGHEPMGVVENVRDGANLINERDRAVMSFNVACGTCLNCLKRYSSVCTSMNPASAGAAYGYVEMGPCPGCQAELMRVPQADWACLQLLADASPPHTMPPSWSKCPRERSSASSAPGRWGLLSAYCSILKGASEVHVVERSEKRLKLARSIGAIPINFTEGARCSRSWNSGGRPQW